MLLVAGEFWQSSKSLLFLRALALLWWYIATEFMWIRSNMTVKWIWRAFNVELFMFYVLHSTWYERKTKRNASVISWFHVRKLICLFCRRNECFIIQWICFFPLFRLFSLFFHSKHNIDYECFITIESNSLASWIFPNKMKYSLFCVCSMLHSAGWSLSKWMSSMVLMMQVLYWIWNSWSITQGISFIVSGRFELTHEIRIVSLYR